MNEDLLRSLLREWIEEEYAVTEIDEFAEELDVSGKPIPHPDIYRRSLESRLAGVQRVAPDHTGLQDQLRGALAALATIRPAEKLYYWGARGVTREYSGVTSAAGLIIVYSLKPPANDRRNA